MGIWHRDGEKGLAKDETKGFEWVKKAADLDYPPALASCGFYYINGLGVEEDATRGLIMMGQAAALGSDYACYVLGHDYENGLGGAKKDRAEAAKWYRRMDGCKHKNCSEEVLAKVAERLREYDGERVSS